MKGSSAAISLSVRGVRVALRRDQLVDRDRPLDADVRVAVGDAALELVVVVVRLLVHHVGDVAEHAEAVREADRAVERCGSSRRSARSPPTRRRSASPCAGRRSRRRSRRARSAPAWRRPRRSGSACRARSWRPEREWLSWHHLLGDPEVGVDAAAVGLREEAALVAEHARLEQDRPVEPRFESLHGRRARGQLRSRPMPRPRGPRSGGRSRATTWPPARARCARGARARSREKTKSSTRRAVAAERLGAGRPPSRARRPRRSAPGRSAAPRATRRRG